MRRIVRLVWLSATGLVLSRPVALGEILYVNNTGPADHVTIQAAIDDALDGDVVLVAPGTYTGDGNRDIDFLGKAITVKSEAGPRTCIIDCQGAEGDYHRGFYFHSEETSASVLDGFTITGGYIGRYQGGGGGISCAWYASPTIRDCVIVGNVASIAGGIALSDSDAVISNCVIAGNCARRWPEQYRAYGGGFMSACGDPVLQNCTIYGNRVQGYGGAMYANNTGRILLDNCILVGSEAFKGSQLYSAGCTMAYGCPEVEVVHCCIEDDPNAIHVASWDDPRAIPENCLRVDPLFVRPGHWVDAGMPGYDWDDVWVDGDYHLMSQAGRWNATSESWVQDNVTSPCIDAGDANSPVGTEPEPNGGIVNIGAYGGTAEASKSYDDRFQTLHVDDDGPADFLTIQAAIDDALDGDVVLVAPGTYTGDGNRDIDFSGKAITVRSEDGPETCIIDCGGKPHVEGLPTRQQANPPLEYHRGFYFHAGEDANSILQGFTITGGYLRGDRGAGIYCYEASPQIVDCIVTGNIADRGGGVSLIGGTPTLNHCLITGNNVGGITAGDSDFVLRNCTISGNRPDGSRGGALYCDSGFNTAILHNCILWGNENRDGNGSEIYLGAGVLPRIHLELNHCVVQDRDDFVMDEVYGTWTSADPCFVQPGYWEANETGRRTWDSDLWVNGDYHLKSQAGRWDRQTASWVYDDVTSPCVDTGDPNNSVGDEPFPNGGSHQHGCVRRHRRGQQIVRRRDPDSLCRR